MADLQSKHPSDFPCQEEPQPQNETNDYWVWCLQLDPFCPRKVGFLGACEGKLQTGIPLPALQISNLPAVTHFSFDRDGMLFSPKKEFCLVRQCQAPISTFLCSPSNASQVPLGNMQELWLWWQQSQWKPHLHVFLNALLFVRLGNDSQVPLDNEPDQNLEKNKKDYEHRVAKEAILMHFVYFLPLPLLLSPFIHKQIPLSTPVSTFWKTASLHRPAMMIQHLFMV